MEDILYTKFLRNAIKNRGKKIFKKKKKKKKRKKERKPNSHHRIIRVRKVKKMQGPNRGSTDIRRYCTIFSTYGDPATGNLCTLEVKEQIF